MVPLCVMLCQENPTLLGEKSAYLAAAIKELDIFYTTMSNETRQMSQTGLARLRQSMTRFLTYWKGFGGHLVYKHHCAWHLVERAAAQGNPRYYWAYADENENRLMSTVAKSLHGGSTFYETFLLKVLPDV